MLCVLFHEYWAGLLSEFGGKSYAIDAADPADRIVVFGSFYTVGGVLKDGLPRLRAAHV